MRSTRLLAGLAVALASALAPATALAHAELESTDPPADATLEQPPAEVALVFSGELSHDGSGFVVTDAAGEPVGEGELDLTVADRSEIRGPVTITEAGTYTVAWTSSALDGHEESGEFTFTVTPRGASGGESPDTAMPAAEDRAARTLGAVLLLSAIAIGVRHLRRTAS